MTARGLHRGHRMAFLGGEWLYEDTLRPVASEPDRPCGACSLPNTPEGHDGCLGELPGVVNACCGHGTTREAYVTFTEGAVLRGEAAVAAMRRLREAPEAQATDG